MTYRDAVQSQEVAGNLVKTRVRRMNATTSRLSARFRVRSYHRTSDDDRATPKVSFGKHTLEGPIERSACFRSPDL